MASYGFPENPSLTTSSRMRVLWLQYVCRYKVLQVRQHPKEGWFGHVKYDSTYLMMPRHMH